MELALCLPIVLVVIAALAEIGLIASDQIRLWHAAREAARVAVVEPTMDKTLDAVRAAGFESVDVSVSPQGPARRMGAPLTVALTLDRVPVVPLVGRFFDGVELQSEATMRIERP